MRAFRIRVDGKSLGACGAEDQTHLHFTVEFVAPSTAPNMEPKKEVLDLSLAGAANPGEAAHCTIGWDAPEIGVGSKIEIEIVEVGVEDAVPPARRILSTEEDFRRGRYQRYLALKEEFEPD